MRPKSNATRIVQRAAITIFSIVSPALAQNLVLNSDFEQGPGFFASTLTYSPGLGGSGKYDLRPDPEGWNSQFAACRDHSFVGNRRMMVIDGYGGANNLFWQEQFDVQPHTRYGIRLWTVTLTALAPPNTPALVVRVFHLLPTPVTHQDFPVAPLNPAADCVWRSIQFVWNSDTATRAQLTLINTVGAVIGNDFAMDDVEFIPLCAGDVDGDFGVNEVDLGILLANWGLSVAPNTSGDLNGDGVVSEPDLGTLLGNWQCTTP
ncbi:MAG: hypothetical protein U1D55_14525 [Phycisphaerae bacterium]